MEVDRKAVRRNIDFLMDAGYEIKPASPEKKRMMPNDEAGDTVTVTAAVNEMSMLQFARSFAPDAVLLEPEELAKKVKDTAEKTVEVYKDVQKGGRKWNT